MNAKWILSGLASAIIALALVENSEAGGESGSNYSEDLTTLSGKRYRGVRLVKVDPNGLVFRHRNGIAKVTFDNLDEGFRDHYGYDRSKAAEFEKAHAVRVKKPVPVLAGGDGIEPGPGPITLTFRTRTLVRRPYQTPCANARTACGGTPWFSHWGRFHPGLAYARFPCRQLAERDFLISSGILPTPPGVSVYRFR